MQVRLSSCFLIGWEGLQRCSVVPVAPFFSFPRLHEQLNESEQAAQCYIKYIQDIYSCGVRQYHGNKRRRKHGVDLTWEVITDCGFLPPSLQEIVEHLEVSTAFRYLAQYYFKCKLWDEASACAQKCCAFNDVSSCTAFALSKGT